MKRLFLMFCFFVMVSGCASMDTHVEQTVKGSQVKIGRYNIAISEDYKYLGNIHRDYMAKDGENVLKSDTKVKVENHVFVKSVSVPEFIFIQVHSLESQWHYRSEVDIDDLTSEDVVRHGIKGNMPYVIREFNKDDELFQKLANLAAKVGQQINHKQYVHMLTQGRNSGRSRRFFVHYFRVFENQPTDAGMETNRSANRAFAITKYGQVDVERTFEVTESERFEKTENGVIHDKNTDLEWYAGPDLDMTCIEANDWVNNLSIDGGGWRMPTIEELQSLYQKGIGNRNMTPLLKTTGWWVWSGDTTGSLSAWYFLKDGREYWYAGHVSNSHRGFAVRPRR